MSGSYVEVYNFQRDLNNYLLATSKRLPEALNHNMKEILIRWYLLIPVGDRAKILADFNRIKWVPSKRKYKSGKIRLIKQKTGMPMAFAIMNWQRKEQGLRTLSGEDARAEVVRMINRRLKHIGALRSGLVKALRVFGSKDENKPQGMRGSGYAIKAVPGFFAKAKAAYSVNTYRSVSGKKVLGIDPRVEGACEQAFRIRQDDILGYLAAKMAEDAKRNNLA